MNSIYISEIKYHKIQASEKDQDQHDYQLLFNSFLPIPSPDVEHSNHTVNIGLFSSYLCT